MENSVANESYLGGMHIPMEKKNHENYGSHVGHQAAAALSFSKKTTLKSQFSTLIFLRVNTFMILKMFLFNVFYVECDIDNNKPLQNFRINP